MAALRILCLLVYCAIFQIASSTPTTTLNDRPIIGILTQEVSRLVTRVYKEEDYRSYIAASYVKFVEGSGGRVVPIWINKSREYYEDILTKLNGVLLPGGATFFNQSQGYADAGMHIYNIAKKMNNDGDYMPIWGTCLGFELLVYLDANETDYRTSCSSSAQSLPLEFTEGFEQSRMFGSASDTIISDFENDNVTINFHIFCFTPETFEKYGLYNNWTVMSVNKDWDGVEFISSVEHKKYPFYGVQFHPEKTMYEFVKKKTIPHTLQSISVSQYLGNFFISESRKNAHQFENKTEEMAQLIYNYIPRYTGAFGSAFQQQYLFTEDGHSFGSVRSSAKNNVHSYIVLLIFINIAAKLAFSFL